MRFEHWLYVLPLRWRTLVRRRRVEQDLDDELQDHVLATVEEHVKAGVGPEEARRLALRGLRDVDRTKEDVRDTWGVAFLDTLRQDVRYGARTLRATPGFTVVAVLTLALGIGANTAVFSLVDGILLSPLPYPQSDRLISVTGTYPNGAFERMRQAMRSLDVAAYAEGHWLTLAGDGEPMRISVTLVSAELMSVLGVKPLIGRLLRPGEDVASRDRFVILGHALWQSRFHGDQRAIGRSIELDGVAREVIAVMPPSFQFPSARTQAWIPLGIDAANQSHYWAGDYMPVVGRLREGRTTGQAHAEIRLFQSGIGAQFPWKMPADWNRDVAVIPMEDAAVSGVRLRLLILMGAVLLVLVTACANVANLSLSRAMAREREIGIRAAIGAGPRRIARQLLTESVLLALVGAATGLLFATQALAVLKLVLPADTPRLAEVHLNWRVLVFAAALAVLSGCAFGLAPVLQALRVRLRVAMDAGGREGRRSIAWPLRAGLTIAQVACAVLLVIAAGLLLRSLWTLTRVDPGFRPDQIVTAVVSPTESVCGTPARCLAFYRAFEDKVQSASGVRGAALVNTLPLTGAVAKRSLEIEGYKSEAPLFWLHAITPDYFRVMDIRVETGRAFTREDTSGGAPVAVVTSATAQRFWPGQSPLGRHVRFVGESHWHTIVGVVSDVRAFDLTRNVPSWIAGAVYVPHGLNATMEDGRIPTDMTLVLRTSMDSADVGAALRRAAGELSGQVAISEVRPMSAVVADAVAAPAATTSLLVTMAALALTLGCIGVYGVLSFLVSRQTRDLGIRLALGAQRRDVFWLVIREGAGLCLAGIVLGVAGAMAMTRWLSSELYGISPTDPATYIAVAAVVSLVTLLACYVPTRRAMGVDPLIALRDQ
jgi:putative ABC transport system permease protein